MSPRARASDHAVIRYLERVYKVNIDGLRKRIERQAQQGVDVGACAVNVGDHKFVLDGSVVTTVLARSWHGGQKRQPDQSPED